MTILSIYNRFVFVKTRKTAGTSLEVHFATQCGSEDIVTPISPANPEHIPRNHEGYYNHMPASEVRTLQPDFFLRAYKFAFERHPVDKCLSYFAMLRHSPAHQSPENPASWVEYLHRGDFPTDAPLYTEIDGALIIDQLYRYEELDQALRDISSKTDLVYRPLNVREKTGFRRDDIPSFESVMADSGARNRIMDAFAPTLRHIDY